jgi:hypothetical protein
VVVDTPGTSCKNPTEAGAKRIQGIIDEVLQFFDKNAMILGRKNSPIFCHGYWGLHHRGSNLFKGCKTLIGYGLPRPNLEEVRNRYYTIYGTFEGWEAYYDYLTAAEVIQFVGRQRAHRFDDDFTLILICSGFNGEFLADLGCKVAHISSYDVREDLGSAIDQRRAGIVNAAINLKNQGKKLTQQALADLCECTQSNISQALTRFWRGWKGFKQKILGELKGLTKSALYFRNEQARNKVWTRVAIASIARDLLVTVDTLGNQAWDHIFEHTPPEELPQIIAVISRLFTLNPIWDDESLEF